MLNELAAMQRRVLGVLIEKSLSQPEYYPMTVNAIVAGCNQKNNRDPLMELDDSAVWDTLDSLREHGLAARILPPPGSRADKFKHEALAHFDWGVRQQAIMAELLLRGAQTLNELRTRCARMATFESAEAVQTCLEALSGATPPFCRQLPRQAGQSAVRFDHCMYPADEAPPAVVTAASAVSPAPSPSRDETIAALQRQVASLESRVRALEVRVNG